MNAVDLLLREYKNVTVYSEATEVTIDGLGILFIPWINQDNVKKTHKLIRLQVATARWGTLNSTDPKLIVDASWTMVIERTISEVARIFGHYHTRSDDGKIFYLGNPYEMFWNDVNDTRGFHIFDTETLEHTPINNPYRLFYNIYYEDTPHQTFDTRDYENNLKVIVRKNSDNKKFEKFLDKLYAANVADLKVVENFTIQVP